MERLTNKREAWAQRKDYENRIANGYPRNIPEERFLRLDAYEDTGLTPKEVQRMSNILLDVGIDYNCSWEYVKNWLLDARLRELAEADKGGRLVVLPCKVGDTAWALIGYAREIRECVVEFVDIGKGYATVVLRTADDAREQYGAPLAGFGRTVFLTREEAEKALEARKDG